MKVVLVKIGTVENVRRFIDASTKQAFDIDLESGRYLIDGKSIMGLFSLDLSKAVTVICHSDDAEAFINLISDMVIEK